MWSARMISSQHCSFSPFSAEAPSHFSLHREVVHTHSGHSELRPMSWGAVVSSLLGIGQVAELMDSQGRTRRSLCLRCRKSWRTLSVVTSLAHPQFHGPSRAQWHTGFYFLALIIKRSREEPLLGPFPPHREGSREETSFPALSPSLPHFHTSLSAA